MFSDEGMLHVSVIDNGVGMGVSTPVRAEKGYQQGLLGLRERADVLGGNLSIESSQIVVRASMSRFLCLANILNTLHISLRRLVIWRQCDHGV